MAELDPESLDRLDSALARHVDESTPGAVWRGGAHAPVPRGFAGRRAEAFMTERFSHATAGLLATGTPAPVGVALIQRLHTI